MTKRYRVKTIAGHFYTDGGYGRFGNANRGSVYCEEHAQELKGMFDKIEAEEKDITFGAEIVTAPQNMVCQKCKKEAF